MKYICYIFLVLLISCNLFKTKYVEDSRVTMPRKNFISPDIYLYNLDFPQKNIEEYRNIYVEDSFEEGGERFGRIIKGRREGKWLSGDADFDKNGKVYAKGRIWREEYFKNDLRDSIYRRFDGDGKIIYETNFKLGTGLWKEFHSNGKIYFEAYTKDGYFTDTLKLYNDKGILFEKLLYKKDSLIFKEITIIDNFPTDNK